MSEKKRGDDLYPPSTICCSFDQEREDSFNRSELTLWPFESERSGDGDDNGENNIDECVHELRPSADADDILKELAADPIFNKSPLDISERALGPPHQAGEGQSTASELRKQIASQQEQLDALTSKLNTCQVENGALKAENNQLVDELSAFRSKGAGETRQPTKTASDLGESSARLLAADDDGLLDKIASLTKDNARLHTIVSVMRKSLQTYIRDSRTREGEDGETIEGLRRENEALRRGGGGGGGEPRRVEELPSRGPSGEEVPNGSSSGRGSGRAHIVPTAGVGTAKVNLKASFATDKTSMETLESSRRSMETLESSQRSSPTIYEELGRASSYRRCRDNNKDRVAKILERGAAANRQSRRASICGVPSKLPTATLADEQQPRMTFRNVVDRGEELLGDFRRHVSERWSSLPNEDLSTASSSEGEEVRGGGEGLLVDFR